MNAIATPRLPRLVAAPGIRFTRNRESGAPLIYRDDGRVFRLSPSLGHVCEIVVTSPTPPDEVQLMARLAGDDWNDDRMVNAVAALLTQGILQLTEGPVALAATARRRRVDLKRPFTLRLTLFDPERLCRRLSPLAKLLRGRRGLVLSGLGVTLQVLLWATGRDRDVASGSWRPVPVLALLLVTCVLHELAHGIVLVDAGGRPRRLGVMLLYLVPAFFCDVSDSFRLSRRDQIDVALAGVFLQAQLGALVALLIPIPGSVGHVAHVYVGLDLVMALGNLMPFVALDGYFALRAAVGTPDLRGAALQAWRRTWRTGLHLDRRSTPLLGGTEPGWLAAYGAGAAILPVVMASWSVDRFLSLWFPGDLPSAVSLVLIPVACAALTRLIPRGLRPAPPAAPSPDHHSRPFGARSGTPSSRRGTGAKGVLRTRARG